MRDMSIPYEATGRTRQKTRTRSALVAAAHELLAEGTMPTVEQAADRAEISRTTAYRYFRNQRALLLATYPELEAPSLLADDAPVDPEARLMLAVDHVTRMSVEHEPELRAQLRLSLEPGVRAEDLVLRQGRVIGWYEDALAPLREQLGRGGLRRLALALRAATGIEAFVWLTDVGGVEPDEAAAIARDMARAILRAALAGD